MEKSQKPERKRNWLLILLVDAVVTIVIVGVAIAFTAR